MAMYIVLGKLTPQGGQSPQDIPERRRANRQRAEALGITFESYLTMGAVDVLWVASAPSEEAMAKFLLGLGAAGNLSTQTLRAFRAAEEIGRAHV